MRKFKTLEDLSAFVKEQINLEIIPDYTFKFKPKKGIGYMQIPNLTPIWSLLREQGIRAEKHLNDKYFVYLA